MAKEPTFTDVQGRKIICHFKHEHGFDYLAVDQMAEDGSQTELLQLNMYDAKKLFAATEMFMQHTIAQNFSNMNGQLTPNDRGELGVEDDD